MENGIDVISLWDVFLNFFTNQVAILLRRLWKLFLMLFIILTASYLCWNNDECHIKTFGVLKYHIFNFSQKLTNSIQHYEQDCWHMYNTGPHPLTSGKNHPRHLGNQTRYIGEDAKFYCIEYIFDYNTSKPHINQVLWFKDDVLVKPDYRHIIRWRYKVLNERTISSESFKIFKIDSVLKILLIEEEDFGVYTCHVSQTAFGIPRTSQKQSYWETGRNEDIHTHCANCEKCHSTPSVEEKDFTIDDEVIKAMFFSYYQIEWVSEYRLLKEKPMIKEVFVAPGTLLTMRTTYRHSGIPEDITIRYTLNGREPTNTNNRCSIFVILYFLFVHGTFDFLTSLSVYLKVNDITEFQRNVSQWTWSGAFYAQCISTNSYGRHDMLITRRTIDASGREILREFTGPLQIDLKPKPSDLLNFYSTNESAKVTAEFDPDCFSQTSHLKAVDCVSVFNLLHDHTEDFFRKEDFLFAVLVIPILYVFYRLFYWIWHRRKELIPLETLANLPMYGEQQLNYHLFISIHEEDLKDMLYLIEILERLKCKLFLTCRDIQPGRPIISAISNAISQSAAFIIVASKNYVRSPVLNDLHTTMILERVTCNLLVIKLNGCRVSEAFMKHFTVVDKTKLSLKQQREKINSWLSSTVFKPNLRLRFVGLMFICCVTLVMNISYLLFKFRKVS